MQSLYTKYYDGSVQAMLLRVWSRFNHRCGKLLAPFTRINIDVIAARKLFKISGGVKAKLKTIGTATIDRILKDTKEKLKIRRTGGTKGGNRFKTPIPIPARFECAGKPPGFFQIDLVRHDGGNPSGEFCYTLTLTDVATGRTIHYAPKNKAAKRIRDSPEHIRRTSPFPLDAIHSDSGSEFLNDPVFNRAIESNIDFSKGRLNRKNDNRYAEQKNRATVRDIAGYCRYPGDRGDSRSASRLQRLRQAD